MHTSVFEFTCYKAYLNGRLPTRGAVRGIRSRLAEKLRCKPAFVTQVLSGKVHFSLEHAIEIDRFFEHGAQESQYFMLMVFRGKAGSQKLESFFADQMEILRRERARVTNQVQAKGLSQESVQKYYSSWIYSAVHVLTMVPEPHDEKSIAKRFNLALETTREAIEFLLLAGLIEEVPGSVGNLRSTQRRIHLGDDSTMIANHHTNWRLRAVDSLISNKPLDLHYSGPIAISRRNAQIIRTQLLDFIRNLEPLLAEPGEEDVHALSLDFFSL